MAKVLLTIDDNLWKFICNISVMSNESTSTVVNNIIEKFDYDFHHSEIKNFNDIKIKDEKINEKHNDDARKVVLLSTSNFEYIKTYDSINEAGKATGLCASSVKYACDKITTCKKRRMMYLRDYKELYGERAEKAILKANLGRAPVIQWSQENDFLEAYPTMLKACEVAETSNAKMSAMFRKSGSNKITLNGYIWTKA